MSWEDRRERLPLRRCVDIHSLNEVINALGLQIFAMRGTVVDDG